MNTSIQERKGRRRHVKQNQSKDQKGFVAYGYPMQQIQSLCLAKSELSKFLFTRHHKMGARLNKNDWKSTGTTALWRHYTTSYAT